jgi:hypothetical protein
VRRTTTTRGGCVAGCDWTGRIAGRFARPPWNSEPQERNGMSALPATRQRLAAERTSAHAADRAVPSEACARGSRSAATHASRGRCSPHDRPSRRSSLQGVGRGPGSNARSAAVRLVRDAVRHDLQCRRSRQSVRPTGVMEPPCGGLFGGQAECRSCVELAARAARCARVSAAAITLASSCSMGATKASRSTRE